MHLKFVALHQLTFSFLNFLCRHPRLLQPKKSSLVIILPKNIIYVNSKQILYYTFRLKVVRNYKRKTDMALWTLETMQAAIADIRTNKISLRKAEQMYGIPHATIRRHLMKTVKTPGKLGRFRCTLNEEYETELLQYIIDMQQRFYGLSLTE